MLTRVEDGRATGVRGDPEHPFTRGSLCAKVRDYEQRVYHPDRVLYPMRRVGAKGSGEFERISWDAALTEIATRCGDIVDEHGPQAILPCSYLGHQGLLNGLHCGDVFFNRLGASVGERTFCNAGATLAYNMTLGNTPGIDPESFAFAKVIVVWGCNVIGSMPHHWPFIREAQKNGAKLIVVDPLRSRTAARADLHIRPRPGTDLALVFGLMHVLVHENLLDNEYAENHIHGLQQLKQTVADYSPEHAAQLTGVSAQEITEFARLYASESATAIRVGVAIERHANGPDTVRAISTLPALTGTWRYPGGGIFQNSGRAFPMQRAAMARPDLIPEGTRVVNVLGLGRALNELNDPPINGLFVYNCNPVISAPEQAEVLRGLARDDLFTVVSEQFITDTARYADIVLPATTQLEQWDLMYAWGHLYLGLNRPAIEPCGEAVSNTELFRRLATAFGFEEADFKRSDEELMAASLDWDHPNLRGVSLEQLMERGWMKLNLGDAATRTPHADGDFPTATGKCEFVATEAARGTQVLVNFRQCYAEQQEALPLNESPEYYPVASAADADLKLVSPKTHFFLNSSYANFSNAKRRSGPQPLWMHPHDAASRGIETDSDVVVSNELGKLRVRCIVTEDTLPGVVVVPHGFWRDEGGTPNASVNLLNPHKPTRLGKAPSFSDTTVRVGRLAD